jgi:hypothetical protein
VFSFPKVLLVGGRLAVFLRAFLARDFVCAAVGEAAAASASFSKGPAQFRFLFDSVARDFILGAAISVFIRWKPVPCSCVILAAASHFLL